MKDKIELNENTFINKTYNELASKDFSLEKLERDKLEL